MIWLPTVENVLLLHQKLIDRSGGSAGVRDLGLIESALARAEAAFGGDRKSTRLNSSHWNKSRMPSSA